MNPPRFSEGVKEPQCSLSCLLQSRQRAGVATSFPRGNSGRRSIAHFISAPFEGFVFCFPGTAQDGAGKANALPSGRNSV
jgi:hypothetical protein